MGRFSNPYRTMTYREPQVGIEPTTARGQNPAVTPQLLAGHSLIARSGADKAGGFAGFGVRNRNATATALPSRTPGFFAGLLASIEAVVGPRREVVLPPCACLEPWPVPAYGGGWWCPKCDRFMAPTQGVA